MKVHIELKDDEVVILQNIANERFMSRNSAAAYLLRMNLVYQTFREIEKLNAENFKKRIEMDKGN